MKSIKQYIKELTAKKKGRYYFGYVSTLFFAMFGTTSCSLVNDDLECPEEQQQIETLNFNISITMHGTGTRSETETGGNSSTGTLAGKDLENTISSLFLVFCDQNDTELSYASVVAVNVVSNNVKKTLNVSMPLADFKEKVLNLTGDNATYNGNAIKLYIVANPTSNIESAIKSGGFNPVSAYYSISGHNTSRLFRTYEISSSSTIPMSNLEAYTIDFSGLTTSEIEKHISSTSPLDLMRYIDITSAQGEEKVLKLERSIARIDFKDITRQNDDLPAFTFPLGVESNKHQKYTLKIQSMQLQNVSKENYVFRHTVLGDASSANYNATSNPGQLFGTENGGGNTYNWILDTDFAAKLVGGLGNNYFINNYIGSYNFYQRYSYMLSKLEANEDDKDNEGYIPWYYVPENVVPDTDIEPQSMATGIAFRVLVCDAKGDNLNPEGSSNTDITKKESEYIDDKEIKHYILRITMPDGEYQDIEYSQATVDFGAEINPAGFYLDYYYFIQHNDKTEGVDPMEYAVVRNNVYQLYVEGFDNLPDPEKPSANIAVAIKVLPWVKRDITVSW